jgi:hypothetical protein
LTERLAIWTSRRPRLTLAGWGLVLVAAIAITAAFLGDALSGDEEVTSNTESRTADRLQDRRLADDGAARRSQLEAALMASLASRHARRRRSTETSAPAAASHWASSSMRTRRKVDRCRA